MVNEDPALSISDLAFQFDAETGSILKIKSWEVDRGKQVFLQGASGSGKSSLLTLLAGLQVPTLGEVRVLGTTISSLSNHERDRFRALNIGVVFQQFNLIPYLSVMDNILLAAKFGGTEGLSVRQRATELLSRVNLKAELYGRKSIDRKPCLYTALF